MCSSDLEVIGALASRAGEEPSAVYLRPHLRPVDRLLAEWRALGPRAGLALLREHLLPPPQYIVSRYGVRWRALLPLLYARRVVVGAGKWFVTPR